MFYSNWELIFVFNLFSEVLVLDILILSIVVSNNLNHFFIFNQNTDKPTLKIGKKLSVEKWLHERIHRGKSD